MNNISGNFKNLSKRPKLDKLQIRISSPTKESIIEAAERIKPILQDILLQTDEIKENRFEDGWRQYFWCALSGVEHEHGEKTETSN